jgi:hypothetical protein
VEVSLDGPRADKEEVMAKKSTSKKKGKKKAAKKKSGPPKEVSVNAVHREIDGMLTKMKEATTTKANKLREKLTTFKASTDCGQTLLLDIGS